MTAPPAHAKALQARIRNQRERGQGRHSPERRAVRAMAAVVVGQMLPESVIKGGGAMQIRLGFDLARGTLDLDVSRSQRDVTQFLADLQHRLDEGWSGFTGLLATGEPPSLDDVPEVYVTHPATVDLSYRGSKWEKVRLDVGHNEIGVVSRGEPALDNAIADLFVAVGLPRPQPVTLMSLPDQIAQKVHACTDPRGAGGRVRDVVDLQLLVRQPHERHAVAAAITRTFAWRAGHPWPTRVESQPRWPREYAEVADGLDLPDLESAIDLLNVYLNEVEQTER